MNYNTPSLTDLRILQGLECPYCSNPSVLVDNSTVYHESSGLIRYCGPCQAYVGVHKGTEEALGSLANAELRQARQAAHYFFDPLWKHKVAMAMIPKREARNLAYTWLSEKLKIHVNYCHIAMFDVEHCMEAVRICKPFYNKLPIAAVTKARRGKFY